MRFDVIALVAGWSLVLLTVPLTISGAIGYIMHDEMSIIVWSFVPPILFCAIVGTLRIVKKPKVPPNLVGRQDVDQCYFFRYIPKIS